MDMNFSPVDFTIPKRVVERAPAAQETLHKMSTRADVSPVMYENRNWWLVVRDGHWAAGHLVTRHGITAQVWRSISRPPRDWSVTPSSWEETRIHRRIKHGTSCRRDYLLPVVVGVHMGLRGAAVWYKTKPQTPNPKPLLYNINK